VTESSTANSAALALFFAALGLLVLYNVILAAVRRGVHEGILLARQTDDVPPPAIDGQ